jgi:SAM-dependent methyltransferase
MHLAFKVARGNESRLLNVPLQTPNSSGQDLRILDLGCGMGIWLLDIAEQYPNTEYLGVDFCAMEPPALLNNVTIRSEVDYEEFWDFDEHLHSWDFIHLQKALGSVSNWGQIYFNILLHLKPGTGWFESVEIDLTPRCDDDSLRPGMLSQWYEYINQAYDMAGRSITYNENTGTDLEQAGFTDIRHERCFLPLNGWPHDRKDHTTGMGYNIALSPSENKTGGYGMDAMSVAPLTRVLQWPVERAHQLCEDALSQASDTNVKVYNWLHVWSARAPEAAA